MNGKIKKLKDNLGGYIFPVTSSKSVYMDDGVTVLNDKIKDHDTQLEQKAQQSALEVEKARINNLVSHAGDTGNNSEVIDLRVGINGEFYPIAGEHIRALGDALTYSEGKNLLNLNDENMALNKAMVIGSVNLVDNTTYFVSGYIPVKEGQTIYPSYNGAYTNVRRVIFFTDISMTSQLSTGNYDSATNQIVVPNGAKFMRVQCANVPLQRTMLSYSNDYIFEDYIAPKYYSIDFSARERIGKNEINIKRINDFDVVLPLDIPILQGDNVVVHYPNTVFGKNYKTLQAIYPIGFTKDFENLGICEVGINETEKKIVRLDYYKDSLGYRDVRKSAYVIPVNKNSGQGKTKKVMFIGDSITDLDIYRSNLYNMFSDDVMNIEFVGTMGDGNIKHEGRSGWRAYTYTKFATTVGNVDYGGRETINPFWNPTTSKFDFSYYMQNQNLSLIDYVFINLGTNDVSRGTNNTPLEIVSYWREIIDSIKAFNNNIKVVLWLCPSKSLLNGYGTAKDFKEGQRGLFKELLSRYEGRESQNIFISPVYLSVDPYNDYAIEEVNVDGVVFKRATDTTHPLKEKGGIKIAKTLYTTIKYIEGLN